MSGGTLVLTLIALVTVVIIPAVVGLAGGMRRSANLVRSCIAAAVIGVLWAIYWVALSDPRHVKHAVLFLGLAVVALVAASFSRPAVSASA